jgi:hypothetical protein
MKTKLTVVAAGLLLTLGPALAGGLIYQQSKAAESAQTPAASALTPRAVTPELIAKWKATAATADYSPPMLPI